ncbi:MAG: DegV family EDD domain-containing protein [Chloroflexi bacterium]|nr:DegV family EDD domain-containing protein [Chloroflexota bacterium]
MTRVAVISDSSCCIPRELLDELGITVVPLGLLIDGEVYEDGALPPGEFYERLKGARQFPTTTSPAPGAFLEAFRRASPEAEAALCITLSARYSGTYSSAVNAAKLLAEELPDFPVRVLDSRNLAMAHGFVVLAASRAAQAGADLDGCVAAAEEVIPRLHLLGMLDTLQYLARSGRVPWIVHWATSALQIKPILAADQEDIKAIARVRTRTRALERLLMRLAEEVDAGRALHVAVMHTDAIATAEELAGQIRERFQPRELLVTEFTSVMGIHSGPGFVGLAFYSEAPVAEHSRGREEVMAAAGSERPALEEDIRRIEASLEPLPPTGQGPSLVVLSGLPGSGKSHFARRLKQRSPLVVLESDALRKALFGRPKYTPEENRRLFDACHAMLDRLLARGMEAVLDATNLREIHRRPLYRIAGKNGARLVLVRLEAPPSLVRRRLEERAQRFNPWDHSDAGVEVYERMRYEAEPITAPHIVVDSSRDIEAALDAVVRALAAEAVQAT